MYKVTNVRLMRAEGPSHLCRKERNVPSLKEATWIIHDWATTAPKDGCYDKVDFTVTWEDGETYEGRFDMKYEHTAAANPIGEQMKEWIMFHFIRPRWMTPEQYKGLGFTEEDEKMAREFLKTHNLEE
jgi:hypothetical protein